MATFHYKYCPPATGYNIPHYPVLNIVNTVIKPIDLTNLPNGVRTQTPIYGSTYTSSSPSTYSFLIGNLNLPYYLTVNNNKQTYYNNPPDQQITIGPTQNDISGKNIGVVAFSPIDYSAMYYADIGFQQYYPSDKANQLNLSNVKAEGLHVIVVMGDFINNSSGEETPDKKDDYAVVAYTSTKSAFILAYIGVNESSDLKCANEQYK